MSSCRGSDADRRSRPSLWDTLVRIALVRVGHIIRTGQESALVQSWLEGGAVNADAALACASVPDTAAAVSRDEWLRISMER